MSDLETALRDGDALCRSVRLPGGETLTRDEGEPWLWHSQLTGCAAPLLELVCHHADADDLAHARYGRGPEDLVRDATSALRRCHGRQFLRRAATGYGGFVIHDELEDPIRGDHELVATPGDQMWGIPHITDAATRDWIGIGPTPDDLRRAYAATAFLAFALNRELGVPFAELRQEWLNLVPVRPWRILETDDALFLMDAHNREIVGLRIGDRPIGSDVTNAEMERASRALAAANAILTKDLKKMPPA